MNSNESIQFLHSSLLHCLFFTFLFILLLLLLPTLLSSRFLRMLMLLVQEAGVGEKAFLPSIIAFTMKQIYPAISSVSALWGWNGMCVYRS